MYCGRCGRQNADDARYCVECGADLSGHTPSRSASTAVDTLDIADTADAAAIRPGRILVGRYRIVEPLGSGGMGEIFKAEDAEMDGMAVAVKVLPAALARNRRSVEALKREAVISLRLTHPNICRLYHFHSDGEMKFLVMEYIVGQTLEELLDSRPQRRLSLDELLPIARQIAAAVDHAHSQKPPILHRDIKPSNIMVAPDGVAKVLDFGIAREMKDSMTRVTGTETSGTLLYMSPEQFSGQTPTPASDVYSLAATVYECLSGRPPFHQGAIGHQILHVPPAEVPHLPAHVNAAIQAGLAKSPAERPAGACQFVAMLSQVPQRTEERSDHLSLDLGGGVSLKCVLIPAGKFIMGSPETEKGCDSNEGPQREVTISRPFYMGITVVTQEQWTAVMGTSPWRDQKYAKEGADNAASCITWNDATEFCAKLSRKTSRTVRLPTEAEWEYACRAGSTTRFCFGDDPDYTKLGDYAWHDKNAWDIGNTYAHPVGRKKANAWGLYDMHGNVWEWCSDWYDSYAEASNADPQGPDSGTYRVLRGGSFGHGDWLCRSAGRYWYFPVFRYYDFGLRVVAGAVGVD